MEGLVERSFLGGDGCNDCHEFQVCLFPDSYEEVLVYIQFVVFGRDVFDCCCWKNSLMISYCGYWKEIAILFAFFLHE